MFFFKEKKEEENNNVNLSAIGNFKFGIERINNGEDPRTVGEITLAIEELKDYQEKEGLSNEKMFEVLENAGISIYNPEIKTALEKSFVVEFSKALDICHFYRDVMDLDLSTETLEKVKDVFIENLNWTSDYKEMVELGKFSEEFLKSERVVEAIERRFKEIIKRGNKGEINSFIEAFDLKDLSFATKEAEEVFIDLAQRGELEKALEIKEIFQLKNCKKLLKDLGDFYNKLN
ncbi:MAG: hypothetical protein PHG24_02050 [Candidatus Pacebacteria bacterium]|nr:hypothetical protein [Candidatus Paceibacterota bacterium]